MGDTSAECSASLSLNATRNKSRPLATPRTHDRSLSVKRCRRSWLPSARNQPSEISSRSASLTRLQRKSPVPAIKSSHSRTSSSVRSRSSRSPSSILPSSWSSTAPRLTPSVQLPPQVKNEEYLYEQIEFNLDG